MGTCMGGMGWRFGRGIGGGGVLGGLVGLRGGMGGGVYGGGGYGGIITVSVVEHLPTFEQHPLKVRPHQRTVG